MRTGPEIKLGSYYHHEKGRSIYVFGKAKTYRWGEVWSIEECDPTGHATSIVEATATRLDDTWIEIGKEEWLREFKNGHRPIDEKLVQ